MAKASASKIAYNAKWAAEHTTNLSCRVKNEYAEKFKAWCKENGVTVSGALSEFVYDTIGERPPESKK